ncbi:MAG: Crp/Fnr family transcriptional regulator [Pseudonocardiales bacterium]
MTITGHVGAARQGRAVTVRAAKLVVNCLADGAACALPSVDVAALATHLVVRKLRPGQLVFAADQRPDGVWIVRSGAVELMAGTGKNPEVSQVLRDGDVFGDIPLLIDSASPYYSRALRGTTCLWLAAQDFLRLLADRPAISRLWLHSCAARYAASQARLLRLLDGSLTQRTAVLLLCESRAGVVALPQATLAAMVGSTRPSVNRVLRTFQQQGLIILNYGQLSILDELRLRQAAGGMLPK